MKGFLLAANKSGAGKTITTQALLCALKNRGIPCVAGKCGPDYIDASYHSYATHFPCGNFDMWMQGKEGVENLLARYDEQLSNSAILLIEGAMALFDGGEGSSSEIARFLGLPVLLLLSAKGLGESIAAEALGYIELGTEKNLTFAGVIVTHIGSERHARFVKDSLLPVLGRYSVPLLGMLPRTSSLEIAHRHLGLSPFFENTEKLEEQGLARWIEKHLYLDGLLEGIEAQKREEKEKKACVFFPMKGKKTLPVAIAYDEAFSFCYADLPAVLSEYGADVHFFSPLRDMPPSFCALYIFSGGYPELYGNVLSKRSDLRDFFQKRLSEGAFFYGECGGYLYLGEGITLQDGSSIPCLGLLPVHGKMTNRLQSLGYREAHFLPSFLANLSVRGHEFHYSECEEAGLSPLWHVTDKDGRDLGTCGSRQNRAMGSFLHLSPEGSREFWKRFLRYIATG